MDTLLSRQLQQAWLETQMRKHKGDLSSSLLTSSSHGNLNPFSQQNTPSSSSSSWDPGTHASPGSAPPTEAQSLDGESFHDPALQFIEHMLMNEDLEERKCMMAECMSYFTTVKGFYEILGSNEVPPLACSNESKPPSVTAEAFKEELYVHNVSDFIDVPQDYSRSNFPGYEEDDNLGVFVEQEGQVWDSAENDEKIRPDGHAHVKLPLHFSTEAESAGSHGANAEEDQWIDDLFAKVDEIAVEQHAPAGVASFPKASRFAYLGHSDSSGSSIFSSQQSTNANSHAEIYEQDSPFKLDSTSPSSVLAGSSSLGFPWSNTGVPNTFNGNGKHNSVLGANGTNPRWSHGTNKVFTRSASDSANSLPSSKTPLVSSNARLKRAASEINGSRPFDTVKSESIGVDLDSIEEESVSFVRNKDLNAEKYASILNEGLGVMQKSMCCNSGAPKQENVGKPTLVVTTVADLKGLLTSCAQAVASNNVRRANEILQEIRQDATPYGSGLQRLAHYFAEALVARLSGTGERLYSVFTNNSPSAAKMLRSHHRYVEVCPFEKISHYFANRAIVEAAKGALRLHIIDYGILYGIQWPSLISALAERKGGPPLLRITGIDFPQPGMLHAERVEMTGKRLEEYAKTYGVPFEYRAFARRWETVQPSSLNLRQDEVVVVNSMNRLHHLLDETVLASNPRKTVLSKICEINPKIFVQGVNNGNYNAPFFMSRFKEALASFSGLFDLLETVMRSDSQERMMVERAILGRTILNVVACEGTERVERPETYRQWQNRTIRAGLDPIPLDRNVLKESQGIANCGYNKNFTVDEDASWMLLSWKGKVVHGLSLWKPRLH